MNIELSLLNIASSVVSSLKVEKKQSYDQLLNSISKNFDDDIKDLFILALTFLYSVEVIDYKKKEDQVEMLL